MRWPAIAVFLCIFLLFFGCNRGHDVSSYEDKGEPVAGDTLITASIGEPSSLIPVLASDSASHDVASYVYNGLVKYDRDLNIVGDLAESWEISEDNLSITFRLKKGVLWQDGHPFTAHDVMYTYKVIVDPKTPTPYAGDFQLVKSARVIDDHTFRVTYGKSFAPALISWGAAILPRHLLEGRDIRETSASLYGRILQTANGEYRTRNEANGYFEIGIFKQGITI